VLVGKGRINIHSSTAKGIGGFDKELTYLHRLILSSFSLLNQRNSQSPIQ